MESRQYSDEIVALLERHGFTDVVGVPDSTLAGFIKKVTYDSSLRHVGAANECEAVGIAIGQYLASGKPSVVYMQNDGLGKLVNPHSSLSCPDVYGVPMLLIVGWRGHPKEHDAHQHRMMGRILAPLLDLLDIGYTTLSGDAVVDERAVIAAIAQMSENSRPHALLVRRGLMDESEVAGTESNADEQPSREEVVDAVVDVFDDKSIIVATTGKASRELYEIMGARGECGSREFYAIGGMGCASAIALGIAEKKKDRSVCIIDGDGAVLMQMGTLATIGNACPGNLKHVVVDNGAHDSTGGQATVSASVDIGAVARACGYRFADRSDGLFDLAAGLANLKDSKGPGILVVKTRCGARLDLGRPTVDPQELKMRLLAGLREES